MGVRTHEDLVCWQLSVEFRDRINALLATPRFRGRFKYCDQLQNAAESIPANLAEGFYRYTHPEIARFFGIALGSLGESLTRLGSARAQSLISSEEYRGTATSRGESSGRNDELAELSAHNQGTHARQAFGHLSPPHHRAPRRTCRTVSPHLSHLVAPFPHLVAPVAPFRTRRTLSHPVAPLRTRRTPPHPFVPIPPRP